MAVLEIHHLWVKKAGVLVEVFLRMVGGECKGEKQEENKSSREQ